jgi:hypothetical protein
MSDTRTGRLGNIAFKKEATFNTYLAADIYLRAASESLEYKKDVTEDPALVGSIYTTDEVETKVRVEGSIEGAVHGDTIGPLLDGVLGAEAAVSDPAEAFLIVNYKGSDNYHRFTKSSDNITSETSTDGSSWTPDSNFGTAGIIDVSAAAFDTMTELQVEIDGYTDYSATLFGKAAAVTTNIPDFAATQTRANDVKVGAMIWMSKNSASTTAKTHTLTPAQLGTLLSSFSFTINRALDTDKSVGITGCKFTSLALSIAAGDLMKVSVPVLGVNEEADKTDLSLTLPTIEAFTALKTKLLVVDDTGAHTNFDEVGKDFSLTIGTNVDQNYVIGSKYMKEQIRQASAIELSGNAINNSTSYALRTKYTNDSRCALYFYFESNSNADTDNAIPFSVLFRIPEFKFSNYNSTLNTPDRLVIALAGKAMKPNNTVYTEHIYAYVVDNDTTVY